MDCALAQRYEQALLETVGPAGRMIGASKAGYRERFPDNAPVFNANIALACGKVWHGDLDLHTDEPLLRELARRVGQTVYVLHERDGRFDNEEQPRLEKAVYRITQTGETSYDHRHLVRGRNGTLNSRPGGLA